MSEGFRPGQVAELLGISVDTVRRWADAGTLRTTRTAAGQRVIDRVDFARFLAEHAATPDEAPVVARSARNRFPGIVTRVTKDKVMAQVEVQAGPHRIVSLISREAADDLRLEPGVAVVASVKSTNVGIDLTEEP
ncbi:MAG TPA: helix-turn-helix transcriptional regulator [Acidimicrobiales bacterium]|nr:helix-turn-helix transcriptional regulator [Acidimicrobiales bacterium]